MFGKSKTATPPSPYVKPIKTGPTDWEAVSHRIMVEVYLKDIARDLCKIREKLGILPEPGTTVMFCTPEEFQKGIEKYGPDFAMHRRPREVQG